GSLWSASGKLLESVTFTNETATGWQDANFATPINISASTTYDVSYLAPHGHYAYDYNYFATAHQNADLVAEQAQSLSGNGIYSYSGAIAYPATASSRSTNYWVDVLFQPSTTSATTSPTPIVTSSSPAASPSNTSSAAPSASSTTPSSVTSSTPAARTTTTSTGGYVQPGSVGYLGSTS